MNHKGEIWVRGTRRGIGQGDPPHRKGLLRHSKEIAKAIVFVQPVALSELAQNANGRTILGNY